MIDDAERPRCVIAIDDAGLSIVDATGLRTTSPACAVATAEGFEIGQPAIARARLDPRRTIDRFWERLDEEPLSTPLGQARSRAHLAYFHLRNAWADAGIGESEALLALPAAFDRRARALTVGIVHALGIPLVGVVESAVAAAATVDDPRTRIVVEIGLHRVTATRVALDVEGGFALDGVRTVATRGLVDLLDAVARKIAAAFVREARFDPLHDAATEQRLHDRLPAWLESLATSPVAPIELEVGARRHRVELSRTLWDEAAGPLFAELASALPAGSLPMLGSRLAALPDALATIGAAARNTGAGAPIALEATTIGRGALAHHAAIRSDPKTPAFVTRLSGPIAGAARPDAGSTGGLPPTHVLAAWRGHPIGERPMLLSNDGPRPLELGETAHGCIVRARAGGVVLEVPEGARVRVNGRTASGETPLHVGDAVRIGTGDHEGEELRMIVVGH